MTDTFKAAVIASAVCLATAAVGVSIVTQRRHAAVAPAALPAPASTLIGTNPPEVNRDAVADWSDFQPVGDRLGFFFDGDSISRGYRSVPIVNDTAYAGGLSFAGGVRADDGGEDVPATFGTLVALHETMLGKYAETPASGFARMWAKLRRTAGPRAPGPAAQLPIFAAVGQGGYTARQALGRTPVARFLNAVSYGRADSRAAGLAYQPVASLVSLGTNDPADGVTPEAFMASMRALRADRERIVREQMDRPDLRWPMLLIQPSRFLDPGRGDGTGDIALAALRLCQQDALFGYVTPLYFLPHVRDATHLTGVGSAWMGAYYALAAWEWFVLGRKPIPFVPAIERVDARTFVLTYPVERGRHLVIDGMVPVANHGITAGDATGAAIAIASVTQDGNALRVRTAADVPAHGWIGVGLAAGGSGSELNKGRTDLRDDRGDLYTIDLGDGMPRRLDRWSAHARLIV